MIPQKIIWNDTYVTQLHVILHTTISEKKNERTKSEGSLMVLWSGEHKKPAFISKRGVWSFSVPTFIMGEKIIMYVTGVTVCVKKSNKFWEHARSKLGPGVSGLKATKTWKNRFYCFDFKKEWDTFSKFFSLLTISEL